MNNELIAYAREQIKLNLKLLGPRDQRTMLIGCGVEPRIVEKEIEDAEIDRAVEAISCRKLSNVMGLIRGTLKERYLARKNTTCIMAEIDYEYNAWECSACGDIWQINNDDTPEKNNTHYCTNCGARIVQYIGQEI